MKIKILVVDDERILLDSISYNLEQAGYEVVTAADGDRALQVAREEKPQLVILDLMLPRVSGWEVCRALRHESQFPRDLPILLLTARGEESDKVKGLEIGADDYLVKPFGMAELLARVRALLRRTQKAAPASATASNLRCGNLELDSDRREVLLHETSGTSREIKLSLKEFELLRVLMLQQGQVVPRASLLEKVWGEDFEGDGRTLDVHIRWLREKVEDIPAQPQRIITARGVGYKFKP